MGYVKITDPNIIDITAWQQVINTLNQHSDSITALTNNFAGAGFPTDYGQSQFSVVYDPGSQAIVYGKVTLVVAENGGVGSGSTSGCQYSAGTYYGTASFSDSTGALFQYSQNPMVTATLQAGGTATPPSNSFSTAIITVSNITTAGFSWRVTGITASKTGPLTLPINWIAVGPR